MPVETQSFGTQEAHPFPFPFTAVTSYVLSLGIEFITTDDSTTHDDYSLTEGLSCILRAKANDCPSFSATSRV